MMVLRILAFIVSEFVEIAITITVLAAVIAREWWKIRRKKK